MRDRADVKGAIITIDAMGSQTAMAADSVDRKADYVLALKGTQGTLPVASIAYVYEQMWNEFNDIDAERHVVKEKGHGREETRHDIQMPVPVNLRDAERWKGLLTIGVAML